MVLSLIAPFLYLFCNLRWKAVIWDGYAMKMGFIFSSNSFPDAY